MLNSGKSTNRLIFSSLMVKGFTGGDNQLWLLDHNPKRARQINRQGLIYEQNNRFEHLPIQTCYSTDVIERADVLFFCVKSYDLVSSLTRWRSLLQHGTLVVFLQNGIGHSPQRVRAGTADGGGVAPT